MKKLFVVLMLLLLVLSLGACGKGKGENNEEDYVVEDIVSEHEDVDNYVKYLKEAKTNEDEDLEYSYYKYEDNSYYLYVDSYSETLFYRAYLSVYETEDSKEALYEDKDHYYLIRPYDYNVIYAECNKSPEYYSFDKVEAYTLNYEKDLNYDWYYDEEDDTEYYCMDIVYDGVLTDDLAEKIVKKEYIINVLTDMWEDNYYLLDNNTIEFNEDGIPVYSKAQYNALIDYDSRTIQLYKDGAELKTITMD